MACPAFTPFSAWSISSILFLALLILHPQRSLAVSYQSDATTIQFKNWYPQFDYTFHTILAQNCTQEYATYLTGIKDTDKINVSTFLGS